MKEYGPQGFNPQDKLTGKGQNPYAERGGKYMAEGNNGGPERPQENQSRNNESHQGQNQENSQAQERPWDPIDSPLYDEPRSPSGTSQREETASSFEQLRDALIRNALAGRDTPLNVDERRSIDMVAQMLASRGQDVQHLHQRLGSSEEANHQQNTYSSERQERSEQQPQDVWRTKAQRAEQAENMRAREVGEDEEGRRPDPVLEAMDTQLNTPTRLSGGRGRRENLIPIENYVGREETRRLLDRKNVREGNWGGIEIESAETLVAEIMKTEKDEQFQLGGRYELLKEVVDENGEKQLEFQADNFLHWVRHWMMYWHNDSPDEEHNFAQKIGLHREYGGSISLDTMINQASRYFRSTKRVKVRDEEGNILKNPDGTDQEANPVYLDLVDQIKKEIWLFSSSRSADIKYQLLMGNDEKLPQTIQELYYLNTFTKTVWDNRSSLYHIMSMPEKFIDEKVADAEGVKADADHRVGSALNLSYLLYYNISDREKLEELLQGTSKGLLDPKRIKQALWEQAAKDKIPEDQLKTYLDPKDFEAIDKDIMSFINIYNTQGKPGRIVSVVRSLIQEAIAEKYGFYVRGDDGKPEEEEYEVYDSVTGKATGEKRTRKKLDITSVSYADTFAFSMTRWTGAAARNDVGAQGYDAWTRLLVTDKYRLKQLEKKRGGAFGNPYTIHVLKQLSTDFMTGTAVEALDEKNYNTDRDDKGRYTRKMTLSVLEEMQKASEKGDKDYDAVASQLVFANNTMRGYANDHLARTFTIFQQVMGAEELKLDKFTEFDVVRGITFDRKGFEETLKEKFFKPMRYGYSTYAQINFAEKVRTHIDGDSYKEVHLAEAMFGRDILDGITDPSFFKEGKDDISVNDDNWSDKIDWNYVNSPEGKVAIWRQVALTRIAAELYQHRDKHSNDPAYGVLYYEQILRALESIPDDVSGDEKSLQSSKAIGSFFTKEDMQWLREKSATKTSQLLRYSTLKQGLFGVGEGLRDIFKESFKAITK